MESPPPPPTPAVAPPTATVTPVVPVPAPAAAAAPDIAAAPKPVPKVNPFIYLGIPQWVFDYKPKMPSRNMSIFLTVTIGITSAYLYDRRECKRLKEEYMAKVRWMSEGKLESGELARRLKVYGARVPEDGELDRSSKWFKRYMRPILVASATDYILTTGTNPGGLGRTILSEIRARRIAQASKDPAFRADARGVIASVLEERDAAYEAKEMEGGIVLLGRGALKEYMWAIRKGYGEEIDLREEGRLEGLGLGSGEKRKDGRWEREEEIMVRELDREDSSNPNAPFDIPDPVGLDSMQDESPAVTNESPLTNIYAPSRSLSIPPPIPASIPAEAVDTESQSLVLPAIPLTPQPPLLLVPFSHPFGVRQWPSKLLHFFNHRSDVKLGGEYALIVINAQTRAFDSPSLRTESNELQGILDEKLVEEMRLGEHKDLTMEEGIKTGSNDLDFLHDTDELPSHFRKTYRSLPSAHEYARRNYYTVELPPRLAQARELAGGRTPTKAEDKYPPKIESELRKERLEKELKWRRELEGWAIQRAGSGIAWEESWGSGIGNETPFRAFRPMTPYEEEETGKAKLEWEEDRKRKEIVLDARDEGLSTQ